MCLNLLHTPTGTKKPFAKKNSCNAINKKNTPTLQSYLLTYV